MIEGSCLCGAVRWSFDGVPAEATACNCTACRRFGALWAYDYENERIKIDGETRAFVRGEALSFNFCATCGCVTHWLGAGADETGRRRIAVNLRMASPAEVGDIVIDHFDGLETWDDLPRDGRCVKDMWF